MRSGLIAFIVFISLKNCTPPSVKDMNIKNGLNNLKIQGLKNKKMEICDRRSIYPNLTKLVEQLDAYDSIKSTRIIRAAIFFFLYAILLEVSLFIVRYSRHYNYHDEYHALFMMIISLIGICIDAWVIIEREQYNFENYYSSINLLMSIINSILLVFQICRYMLKKKDLGFATRFKMVSSTYSPNYYRTRTIHLITGMIIWLVVKIKIYVTLRQIDLEYYFRVSLQLIFACYVIMLIIARLFFELHIKRLNKFWRLKSAYTKSSLYNTERLKKHRLLQEMINLEDIDGVKDIFRSLNYVMLEDKIYDLKGIAHPGGYFIFKNIKALEISRYFYGQHPFERFYTQHADIIHRHSTWAMNLLDKRFIGFVSIPKIFKRSEAAMSQVSEYIPGKQIDSDQDQLLSQSEVHYLESLRITRTEKMKNSKLPYSWYVYKIIDISKSLYLVYLDSLEYNVIHDSDPFQIFGKYVNIRFKGRGRNKPLPYTVVMSLSPINQRLRKNLFLILKNYFDESPGDERSIVEPKQEKLERLENPLPLLIRQHGRKSRSNIFFSCKERMPMFTLKGPIGEGLLIKKFSAGHHILVGAGTGNTCFVDLVDFIAKKSIFESLDNVYQHDGPINDIDIEFYKLCFFNHPTFAFYLSFRYSSEFELCFKECLDIIAYVRDLRLPNRSNLIYKVLVRISNYSNNFLKGSYPDFVEFIDMRFEGEEEINTITALLGVDNPSLDLSRVIVAGPQDLVRIVNERFNNIPNIFSTC